jgi:hypothetical protein
MKDPACGLRRIHLLRTRVNRTKKKDRGGSKLRLGRTPDTRVLYLAFNLRGKHRQGRRYPYIPGTSSFSHRARLTRGRSRSPIPYRWP